MKPAIPALALSCHGAARTRATSDAARHVADQIEIGRRRLKNSDILGLGVVFNELFGVAEECKTPNWDGHGGRGVAEETYRFAYCFLEALPFGTPPPTVGAEPDGHLTFEWHRSPRRTLSVSISPEGDLHYAALLGPRDKDYGTKPFYGEIPMPILDLIARVTAA
jgi:hypothetical protein